MKPQKTTLKSNFPLWQSTTQDHPCLVFKAPTTTQISTSPINLDHGQYLNPHAHLHHNYKRLNRPGDTQILLRPPHTKARMLPRLLLTARSALRPSACLTKCVAPRAAAPLSTAVLAKTAAATTRPTATSAVVVVKKGVDGVTEQVRGMKVRASVKKLCEGCKVRLV